MTTSPRDPKPNAAHDPLTIAGDAAATADLITLQGAQATPFITRPSEISRLWVEDEYDELTQEQTELWDAHALDEARAHMVQHASLNLRAAELAHTVAGSRELLDTARTQYTHASTSLSAYRRRAPGAKRWYKAAKAIIFIGDLAGFATAAIWLGEPIFIAVTLAASAAAATVVAGLIGTEYCDLRRRRLRACSPHDLPSELAQFEHLFTESPSGESIMKRVLLVSLMTAVMVSVAIGALRAAVDEPLVGVIFAGIAFAVAGGSFLVSYAGADEIADLIDRYHGEYVTQEKRHLTLSSDQAWHDWAGHGAQAGSIQDAAHRRGQAARSHVQALKWRILRNNPSVAGHGPSDSEHVGRVPRKSVKPS